MTTAQQIDIKLNYRKPPVGLSVKPIYIAPYVHDRSAAAESTPQWLGNTRCGPTAKMYN